MARAELRRQRRRRRRLAVAIGTVTVLVVGLGIGAVALLQTDSGGSSAAPDVTATIAPLTVAPTTIAVTAPATVPPAPTTTSPLSVPLDVDRRYAVGVHQVTYVDSSRSTSANGSFEGASTRTLPTTIWYPAQGDPGNAAQSDAPPDRDHGRYPLVLFAHGYDVTPDFYRPMLERWAAAGYVVVAPTFPILSGIPGGASHTDYEKTFDDASFVISRVLDTATTDPVAALVDPARIAAAGHSDGETIAFGIGFLACCRDARVSAVIPMAGDLSRSNNPHVRDTGIPILHIMETNDEFDPYDHSIAWDRDNLTAPRWLLTLENASHVPPYTRPGNPYFELVMATTIDFLDGTLKGHPERLDRIKTDVAANPTLADLER
jgi:dienelactone hydrolase